MAGTDLKSVPGRAHRTALRAVRAGYIRTSMPRAAMLRFASPMLYSPK